MNMGELAVTVLEVQVYPTGCLCASAADLCEAKLETFGHVDADPMFGTGHGIEDRLTRHFEDPRDIDTPPPRFDIDVERDRLEQRLELVRGHGRVYPPHRGHFLGFLARHDLQERVALLRIGPFVDD